MHSILSRGAFLFLVFANAVASQAQWDAAALVRRAPQISGRLEGSLRQVVPEAIAFSGRAHVTHDLIVPGLPTVQLTGRARYEGAIDLGRASSSEAYAIALGGNATVRHVVRGAGSIGFPAEMIDFAPSPVESEAGGAPRRIVEIAGAGQSIALAPGCYGDCRVAAGATLRLGSRTEQAAMHYSFESLNVAAGAQVEVLGTVVVRVRSEVHASGVVGGSEDLRGLRMQVDGGVRIGANGRFHGYVFAPRGLVEVRGNAELAGGVIAERLLIGGNAVVRVVPFASDNEAPWIELETPANGSVFAVGEEVTISALAVDLDGTVERVEFFAGAMRLGEASAVPFAISLVDLPAGTHALRARAFDNEGRVADSNESVVRVIGPNLPPTVWLRQPVDGALWSSPANVELEAEASDADGHVERVEFLRDGIAFAAVGARPYRTVNSSLPEGTYRYSAKAWDDRGAATESPPVTITVSTPNVPPTVTVVEPPADAVVAVHSEIVLRAAAEDVDGTIQHVRFFENLVDLGSATSAPYVQRVTLTEAREHYFVARALDDAGAASDSAPVRVIVRAADEVVSRAPVPFIERFELEDGYVPGPISGAEWDVSEASIATDMVSGKQHALLAAGSSGSFLKRSIAGPSETVVFIDLMVRAPAAEEIAESSRFVTSMADIALVREGEAARVMVRQNDEWVATRALLPIGEWFRLTTREDYREGFWDLFVNGELVAARNAPAGVLIDRILEFGVVGATVGDTCVDELSVWLENPLGRDEDGDGMLDEWELAQGLDSARDDRYADADFDGIRNVFELAAGLSPANGDTDLDGLGDGWEIEGGSDPLVSDAEADADADGLSNLEEFRRGTRPDLADSDFDGMADGWEASHGFDPRVDDASADADRDGYSNAEEYASGTDPNDYYNGDPPVLTSLVDPDGRLSADGAIEILIVDANGEPLPDAPVTLRRWSGDHLLATAPTAVAAEEISVRAGNDGIARAWVRGGTP